MTDEEYIFRTDTAEKKRTARGSFNRRTHAGKGGRVKMPSDYMTKKERDAMNGEVQSYNLSKPMKWEQFKLLTDDIKREYITSIVSKYDPQQSAISQMLNVAPNTLCMLCKRLGITFRHSGCDKSRNDAFWAWVNGIDNVAATGVNKEPLPASGNAAPVEPTVEPAKEPKKTPTGTATPTNGVLEFTDTTAQDAFNAAYALLTTTAMQRLVISWEAAHD